MRASFLFLIISALVGPALAEPSARRVAPWIQSAVVYEINPRTFSPEGNFRGIERRLDDLKELGVTVLWLMPIHPIGQKEKKGTVGSAYAVRDYYAIHASYGTKYDLKHLVAEAHRRGLHVILDMVLNHTAWDSVLMQHSEYYHHDAQGKIMRPDPDWADVAWLDYQNRELRVYMIEMLKSWVRDFDLDGFRCDVAGGVPTDFWEAARSALEIVKPDLLLIAEANKPELLVRAFDLDYAWPFHTVLTDVAENGAPASTLAESWAREKRRYSEGALEMRFSDNHDEKRAIARFGERGALAASALVFTMDGVPMLYAGMEVGDTTESLAPALFENLPVYWGIAERRPEFRRFYKQLIALRRAHPALQQGDTEWLKNSAPERVVTFVRRRGGEEYFVAVNLSNQPFLGTVALVGRFQDDTPALAPGVAPGVTPSVTRPVQLPALSLDAWGVKILKRLPAH